MQTQNRFSTALCVIFHSALYVLFCQYKTGSLVFIVFLCRSSTCLSLSCCEQLGAWAAFDTQEDEDDDASCYLVLIWPLPFFHQPMILTPGGHLVVFYKLFPHSNIYNWRFMGLIALLILCPSLPLAMMRWTWHKLTRCVLVYYYHTRGSCSSEFMLH